MCAARDIKRQQQAESTTNTSTSTFTTATRRARELELRQSPPNTSPSFHSFQIYCTSSRSATSLLHRRARPKASHSASTMAFIDHGRSDSSDTSSTGSSYQHILDHVLTYNAGYELPLRTMYTLNSAPRAQPLPPRRGTPTSSSSSSPTSPVVSNAWHDSSTTNVFNENLMAQMSHLPTQPTSLPPSFITSFLGRCFPPDLVCVDFPQALTGLDYLKDLETRRQRELIYSLGRLQIDPAILENEVELRQQYPGVARWKRSIKDREHIIESQYTGLYIGLRRWVSS